MLSRRRAVSPPGSCPNLSGTFALCLEYEQEDMADAPVAQTGRSNSGVNPGRVLWAGPLTLLASVVVVAIIRLIAVHILMPDPDFQPLNPEPPIFDTVLFGGAAVFLFFRMSTYSLSPIAEYRSLAWKVLIVSFIPDVLVALRHSWGGGWPEAFALMTMHVSVWALCVTMLPGLSRRRSVPRASDHPPAAS